MPAAKHIKIYRDNIHGITKNAIKRLSLVAGCVRIDFAVVEVVRNFILERMRSLLKDCVLYMEHVKRKSLKYEDLLSAIKLRGGNIYGGNNEKSKFELCKNIEAIKKGLKKGNCVYSSKIVFKRLIQEILQDISENVIRMTPGFTENFQYYMEHQVIFLFMHANDLTMGIAKKMTVTGENVKYISDLLSKGNCIMSAPVGIAEKYKEKHPEIFKKKRKKKSTAKTSKKK